LLPRFPLWFCRCNKKKIVAQPEALQESRLGAQGGAATDVCRESALAILNVQPQQVRDETSDVHQLLLHPSEIHFTHDSIKSVFLCGRRVKDTLNQLLNRQIAIEDIPRMTVACKGGKYWTFTGNRRLYVFRELAANSNIQTLRVTFTCERISKRKFTTKNGGISVRMRGQ